MHGSRLTPRAWHERQSLSRQTDQRLRPAGSNKYGPASRSESPLVGWPTLVGQKFGPSELSGASRGLERAQPSAPVYDEQDTPCVGKSDGFRDNSQRSLAGTLGRGEALEVLRDPLGP